MFWATALATYFLVWWMVLFAVLPMFGVRRAEAPDPSNEPGAPARPRLLLKAAVTTAISAVIWLIGYLIARTGWIEDFLYK
ncbi:MAG: DUF1467 family protein [Alphaproteobacteria bacterium]|nr:DUF1467 family protein [Alphaproteobacteria bacterium]